MFTFAKMYLHLARWDHRNVFNFAVTGPFFNLNLILALQEKTDAEGRICQSCTHFIETWKCQSHGGARGKVSGSTKSAGFILREPWMSIAFHSSPSHSSDFSVRTELVCRPTVERLAWLKKEFPYVSSCSDHKASSSGTHVNTKTFVYT